MTNIGQNLAAYPKRERRTYRAGAQDALEELTRRLTSFNLFAPGSAIEIVTESILKQIDQEERSRTNV